MKPWLFSGALASLLIASLSSLSSAQDIPGLLSPAQIDPEAEKVLREAAGFYQQTKCAAAAASGRSWFAMLLNGGAIKVIDIDAVRIIAETGTGADRGDLAWLEAGDGPLLVVTARDELRAFRITK